MKQEQKIAEEIQETFKEALIETRKSNGLRFFSPAVYARLRETMPDFTPQWWYEAEPWCCPACWQGIPSTQRQGEYPGALSRRGDYYVCSDCGNREAFEDFAGVTVEET